MEILLRLRPLPPHLKLSVPPGPPRSNPSKRPNPRANNQHPSNPQRSKP
jgi:hypothetical protein